MVVTALTTTSASVGDHKSFIGSPTCSCYTQLVSITFMVSVDCSLNFVHIILATGFTFLALLSLFPLIFTKGLRMYPSPMFSLLSLLSAIFSLLAFVFMIALFATALERFHDDDIGASFGPLVSQSFATFCTITDPISALDVACCHNHPDRCIRTLGMRHHVPRKTFTLRYICAYDELRLRLNALA
jgi:hypothetical protein